MSSMTVKHDREHLYIDGSWVASSGSNKLTLIDPATEQTLGQVPSGTAQDVDRAVRAAARAAPGWAATPVAERVRLCRAIGDRLARCADRVALLASREMGAPWPFSVMVQAGLPVTDFIATAQAAEQMSWSWESGNSVVTRRPLGVIGAITPWNFPLHQIAAKVAAALVAGCTVVNKPAESTPGVAYLLAEVCDEAGLPPGVFNLVTGTGPEVGEAIVRHPQVDMVSFTGSPRAGRRIAELAAAAPKPTALELGGKSAGVLLDDLSGDSFQAAVGATFQGCLVNSGQTCSALTRLVVPRARLEQAISILRALAENVVLGNPFAPDTQQGPLVSASQRQQVCARIDAAVEAGARLVAGGSEAPNIDSPGYFVQPTVLVAEAGARIEQEEVFGPVLTVVPYDGGDEPALAVANGTPYGLVAAVWSDDRQRARAFGERLRAGQVMINGGTYNPTAPFGGFGQSGYGRELGVPGIEEFTSLVSLQL